MSLLRRLSRVAAAAAVVLAVRTSAAAEAGPRVTFVEACPAVGEAAVAAVGIRIDAAGVSGPAHVVVLVDTSASQTGGFRRQALDAVAGLLETARPADRFAVATVDVACVPACDGFHPADSDAIRAAARAVDAKTPLGSTDLVAGLEKAADLLGDLPGSRAVVYVGDGPSLGGIDTDEFARVVDRLRGRRIAVSSLGVGPQVNWPCLASLASATGGTMVVPGEDDAAKAVGGRIGSQAVQTVFWPADVKLEAAGEPAHRMLPTRLPPLRSDRDSVVLVEGPLAATRIAATLTDASGASRRVEIAIPAAEPREEHAFIAELARNARDSGGLFLPLLGREGLQLARDVIRGEAAALAAMSRQAEAAGAPESARRLAEASLRRDPDNAEAAVVREASQRRAAPPAAADGLEVELAPPAGVEPDDLAEMRSMRRVRGQQLERETAVRIREARTLLTTDPDRSRDLLKEAQMLVSRSDDLDDADRTRLLRELEMRVRESIVRSREKVDRDLAAERRAAIGREKLRLDDELRRREDRIKQLVERYNALVEEGIRDGYAQPEYYPAVIGGEAVIGAETPTRALSEAERTVGEEIAKEAPPLWANHPIPMTARVIGRTAPIVARILDYDAENWRTRRDQQRGFMDNLHLVDAAGIPFADEPPIVYPTAERWREITRLREKYKSVDLANPTPNEKKIYESLEKEVTKTFNFQESPLRDVINQLQDEFNVPIVPDMQALTDAGMDLDATTVTKKLQGVSLRSALRLLLRDPGLTYLIKDEVLLITTKEKAQENLVVKVYPVADLVLPVNPSAGLNPFQTGGGLGGQNSINSGMNMGGMGGGGGGMGGGMGGMGGFCWIAREVYGAHDPRWLVFRGWMMAEAPAWLRDLYAAHGPVVADWLRARPAAKGVLRRLMNVVVEPRLPAAWAGAGQFQVADAKARLARATVTAEPPAAGEAEDDIGLPADVLDATDLRAAVAAYLADPAAGRPAASVSDARATALRLAQVRVSARDLGKAGKFDRAADLISAAISCGRAEPWMYESLALALEAAGRPREEVERALLSSADFATSPVDLLQLANYLARFGSDRQAVRICRRVVRLDPANREAYALAMTVAARSDDTEALRWACAGVLAHEWPAAQQAIVTRAARLSRATIDALSKAGKADAAAAFEAEIDAALVRDLVVELTWGGDADIDILVEEPPGTVCSPAAPRSSSGGVVLADSGTAGVHRERYVVAEAFPGTYRVLVRRTCGKVEADTVTAETIVNRGTDGEQRQKKQIRLGADESLIVVNLDGGRRREPLLDAQVAQDVVVQKQIGQAVLAQQLATIADPQAAAAIAASRGGAGLPPAGGLPFFRGGAVGYQPVVTTLPEGVNMFARAVVSADRRYVRITATPLFSGVGAVTTFNWQSGQAANITAQSAGGVGAGGVAAGAGVAAGGGGGAAAGAGVGAGAGVAAGGGGVGGGVGGVGAGAGAGGAGGVGGVGGVGGAGAAGICWVARAVYGENDPRWVVFRGWLLAEAPAWLRDVYVARGEAVADWIRDKPAARAAIRSLMDRVVAGRLVPPSGP